MVGRRGSKLIINADDLGIHPNIDAGIFEAFTNGILTSATLLVTTPYAAAAAEAARKIGLPTGLHFSLTLGKSAAPAGEVPDLVDDEGNLDWSAAKLLGLGNRPKRDPIYRQLAREMDAQFSTAVELGAALTHVDSHQHVHMNPRIFAMLEDTAERYGVRRMRLCREPLFWFEMLGADLFGNLRRLNPIKLALVRYLGRRITPRLTTNDRFFGLMYSGHVTRTALDRLLGHISGSGEVFEIGLHPGRRAPPDCMAYPQPGYNAFISSPNREAELLLLTAADLAQRVRHKGIELMSYGDLK